MQQPNLKTQSKKKLGRFEVVRRNNFSSTAPFEEQTWAVSYADFLMVLLSFFIIFFNTDDKTEKNNIILKITNEIQGTSQNSSGTAANDRQTASSSDSLAEGTTTNPTTAKPNAEQSVNTKVILNHISDQLKDFQFMDKEKEHSISILLPDNAYSPGQYNLNSSLKNQFDSLIQKLKIYNGQIEITVVGHSDKLSVRNPAGRRFEDNLELSALRASTAVRRALALGIDENLIKIKTLVIDTRNTRSISLQIKTL